MKPQGLPKVLKSFPTIPHVCQNGSPRSHNGAKRQPKVPKRHHKALQSATKTKKHVQTARGRVLAEGDVDPAAGSRDEPTRLHVEVPFEGLRYKYTRALLILKLCSYTQVTGCRLCRRPFPPPHFLDQRIIRNSLKKQRAPMEAQRVKTRGSNPNPTAQAQSKRCLPLTTKTQKIIEFVSISASMLGAFFEHFPQKWHEGSRATPKSAHKTPPWTPRVPKWSPRVPK